MANSHQLSAGLGRSFDARRYLPAAHSPLLVVQPGKVADLAAFDGDPTRDIEAASRVVAVFQAGVRVG